VSIAAGLELARDRIAELRAATADALFEQQRRWQEQLESMRSALADEVNDLYAGSAAGASE
ncbi:MAG: hypothetical protein M3R37_01885, partial [Actinomycetota bacterium]|nr:hypothetical protein [Actinomycetota bacterium]